MSHELSSRLTQAVALAARIHGRDARKGTQIPVLAHLFNVCLLVQQDGGSEDEAIAALLHDSLEDHPEDVSAADLESQFGARVRRIVELSSDTPANFGGGPKPPWRERKHFYLEHARHADSVDLRVTVADKVDNLRAMVGDLSRVGAGLWSRFNAPKEDQLWYYRSALEAYRSSGFSGPLLTEMEQLVLALEQS